MTEMEQIPPLVMRQYNAVMDQDVWQEGRAEALRLHQVLRESGGETERMERPKLQRILADSQEFVERLLEKLAAPDAANPLRAAEGRIRDFVEQGSDDLIWSRRVLTRDLLKLQQQSSAYDLVSEPAGSLEAVIKAVNAVRLPAGKDMQRLLSDFASRTEIHLGNVQSHSANKNTTLRRYRRIVGSGFGRIKRLFASGNELRFIEGQLRQLDELREKCLKSGAQIQAFQESFRSKLEIVVNRLEAQIAEQKLKYRAEADQCVQEYRNLIGATRVEFNEDVEALERYAFIAPLRDSLERLKQAISLITVEENDAIHQYARSVDAWLLQLKNWEFGLLLAKLRRSFLNLEEAIPANTVEIRPAYSIHDHMPQDFSLLSYKYAVPEELQLNTAYFRPYTVWVGVLALGFILIWNRSSLLGLADELRSRLAAAEPAASQEISPAEEVAETEAAEEAVVEQEVAKAVGTATIVAELLNIRSEPGTKGLIKGTAAKGDSYPVYEVRDGWLLIGEDNWISGNSKYVSYEPSDMEQ